MDDKYELCRLIEDKWDMFYGEVLINPRDFYDLVCDYFKSTPKKRVKPLPKLNEKHYELLDERGRKL